MSWIEDAQDWLPEAQRLAEDRRRLDEQLAAPHSPVIEAALRDERRWLAQQQRRFLRQPVDLEARLDVEAGTHRVRICDVSEGGALLELDHPLEPGARAQLRFTLLPECRATWCLVRHASSQTGRVGVQFEGEPSDNARLAAELVRRHAVPPPPGG
jgi:hypothetical protein